MAPPTPPPGDPPHGPADCSADNTASTSAKSQRFESTARGTQTSTRADLPEAVLRIDCAARDAGNSADGSTDDRAHHASRYRPGDRSADRAADAADDGVPDAGGQTEQPEGIDQVDGILQHVAVQVGVSAEKTYRILAGPAPNPRIVVPGAEAQELRVTIVQAPPANPSSLQLWLVAVNTRRASSFLVAFFAVHRKHRLPQSETQSPQSRE